jgi:hypothetical protein
MGCLPHVVIARQGVFCHIAGLLLTAEYCITVVPESEKNPSATTRRIIAKPVTIR